MSTLGYTVSNWQDKVEEIDPRLFESTAGRKALCETDPFLFTLIYFTGHIKDDEGNITFGEHHFEWFDLALNWMHPSPQPRQFRDAFLSPRSSGKSSFWFLFLPMWWAAFGYSKFLAAFADSAEQAERHLQTFKMELEENELLNEDYPELCAAGTRKRGTVKGDAKNMRWCSNGFVFIAKGVDSQSLGMKVGKTRPDTLLCHEAGTPMLHEGKWMPVENHPSFQGFREDDAYHVQVWGLPFEEVVTPEHRYWAKWANGSRNKYRDADWCEAQKLEKFHYLGTPIDLTVEGPQHIPVRYKYITERNDKGQSKGVAWDSRLEVPEYMLDPEFWWLVGLWWGDGHLGSKNTGQIGITVAHTQPEIAERVIKYLSSVGHRVSTVTPKTSTGCNQLIFSWTDVQKWLRTWKSGNSRKTPPTWVEKLPFAVQESLVEGYLDSDGYTTEDAHRITSVHLEGLLSLRRILARLGHAATIRKGAEPRYETFPNGHTSLSQQKYDIRWSRRQGRYTINRTHIKDGFLWNKIRSVEKQGIAKFAPIKTVSSTYVTDFGLSHNCDDIEPDESNYSLYQMEQRLISIQDAIMPLNERARVVLSGTVTMPGSITHQLVKYASGVEDVDGDRKWIEEENFQVHHQLPIIDNGDGTERSMWPAKWPLEYLQKYRHTRGYQKNFLNDPMASDGEYWTKDDFTYEDFECTSTILSIDGAVTTTKESDYTGLAVVGFHPGTRVNGKRKVPPRCNIKYARKVKLKGDALRKFIHNILDSFPEIRVIYVETNQGGDHWFDVLHGMPVKIVTFKQSEKKESRAGRFLNLYQLIPTRVTHSQPLYQLEEEQVAFPNGMNDDLVDAAGSAVLKFLSPERRPKVRTKSITPR